MSPFKHRSSHWLVATLAAMGIVPFVLPQAGMAQEVEGETVQPLDLFQDDFKNPNEIDSLTGDGLNGLNIYDILHRMNFDRGRSVGEFVSDQEESLLEDAADFRTRQLELIRQQRQAQQEAESTEVVESPE